VNLVLAHLGFAACVALATWAQHLTGFAFALILLGLVGAFNLAPLADAADAATLLTLLQAAIHFRRQPLTPQWRIVRPTLVASLAGVTIGVALLGWLGGHAMQALRALLGLAILGCAGLLMLRAAPRPALSGERGFALAGAVSGVMGGLFSSPGPPLVYHLYRQPLERRVVQQCLLLMFAANAALRLVLVLAAGRLSLRAVALGACAVPAVWAVHQWQQRRPTRLGADGVRRLVGALLVLAGLALVGGAARSALGLLPGMRGPA
jgi:uncharacterized membrane protein YfcA